MAVVDVTLDNVVRRALAMNGTPLHYYVPMLILAKRGLEEMHFNSLGKLKYVELDVPANTVDMIANLPSDFVEEVKVSLKVGDKIKPLGRNENINKNTNAGAAFPIQPTQTTPAISYSIPALWLSNFYNEFGASKGRNFGLKNTWDNSYTINRELGFIRIDNRFVEATKILLIYLTLPQKVSNQSVIHPFAQNTLIDYIFWKWEDRTRGPRVGALRHEFFESYRKLRAMLNKATVVEFIRALRRHNNLAIK